MFIKRLVVKTNDDEPVIIRDIEFHKGLNLIVDETSTSDTYQTGNSVGKTTVLRLVDFCLGAARSVVYKAERREKDEARPARSRRRGRACATAPLSAGEKRCRATAALGAEAGTS